MQAKDRQGLRQNARGSTSGSTYLQAPRNPSATADDPVVAQVDDDEEELDNNFRQMQRLRKEKKLLSTIPEGPEDAAEQNKVDSHLMEAGDYSDADYSGNQRFASAAFNRAGSRQGSAADRPASAAVAIEPDFVSERSQSRKSSHNYMGKQSFGGGDAPMLAPIDEESPLITG